MRFIGVNDDLLFKVIYTSKFDNFEGELVFGVKSKPFKLEDTPSWQKPTNELVAIHYLEFQPKDADGTCITLYLNKDVFIESH